MQTLSENLRQFIHQVKIKGFAEGDMTAEWVEGGVELCL
jgi:hypothetical protein